MAMLVFILGFYIFMLFFFFKQKTAYEMRISDWSSDVCSSDLLREGDQIVHPRHGAVVLHDLADHAGRVEAGQPRHVHGRFRMARADKDAALARDQRKHMARRHDMLAVFRRIDRDRKSTRLNSSH